MPPAKPKRERTFEGNIRAAVEFSKVAYLPSKKKAEGMDEDAAAVATVKFFGEDARTLLSTLAEFTERGTVILEAKVYQEMVWPAAEAQTGKGTSHMPGDRKPAAVTEVSAILGIPVAELDIKGTVVVIRATGEVAAVTDQQLDDYRWEQAG